MTIYELSFTDSLLIFLFADATHGSLCPHFLHYIFIDLSVYLCGSEFSVNFLVFSFQSNFVFASSRCLSDKKDH